MLNKEKFKKIVKEKGYSNLKEFSDASKIAYTTIYYVMQGHDMNTSTLSILADFLKEPISSLIDRECEYVLYKEEDNKTICEHINATNNYEVVVKYMM